MTYYIKIKLMEHNEHISFNVAALGLDYGIQAPDEGGAGLGDLGHAELGHVPLH